MGSVFTLPLFLLCQITYVSESGQFLYQLSSSLVTSSFTLIKQKLHSPYELTGPEKYREHGSAAPRKGHFCSEGRCHFNGKQYIFDVKRLILMTFREI